MSDLRILVTGSKGQLGSDIVKIFTNWGFVVYGFAREELDITDIEKINQIIENIKPNIIIHTAAYTNVDRAEVDSDCAFLVNAYGTRNLVNVAERIGAKFVYISTDYVFDGVSNVPYNEFASTNPINVYGKSKLAGEQFVRDFHSRYYIIRTSWVFGETGNNFVKTMLRLAKEKRELLVVDDQIGCPTYSVDLANCILSLIQSENYGVYHVSNTGYCSWYEFALAIFEEANINITVKPCKSIDFPRTALRPAYSVLDQLALRLNGLAEMREWRGALKSFLKNYKGHIR